MEEEAAAHVPPPELAKTRDEVSCELWGGVSPTRAALWVCLLSQIVLLPALIIHNFISNCMRFVMVFV